MESNIRQSANNTPLNRKWKHLTMKMTIISETLSICQYALTKFKAYAMIRHSVACLMILENIHVFD